MILGVVVTDYRHAKTAYQVMREALNRKWSVKVFLTDDGVNMIKDHEFLDMAENEAAHSAFICEHSVERYCKDVDLTKIEAFVVVGGQYQNAELVHNSERVLVF
ncbi:MAG: DsrE family protein [Gammaproteobacteria bacterium]|nr:DsrE family protein [Gammaproteobacteria bacterium]